MNRSLCVLVAITAAATLAACGSGAPSNDSAANGTKSEATVAAPEQAVIVHLTKTNLDDVFTIEDQLEPAIDRAGVGVYDGNEVAVDGSEAVLYAYGPDADALWDVMKRIIDGAAPKTGSYAIKYYGDASDPSARTVRVDLRGK